MIACTFEVVSGYQARKVEAVGEVRMGHYGGTVSKRQVVSIVGLFEKQMVLSIREARKAWDSQLIRLFEDGGVSMPGARQTS